MTYRIIALSATALTVLGACGGGSTGASGGFSAATMNAQATYSTGPSDTASASLAGDGITGTIAVAPGLGSSAGLRNIKIRASGDYQTIYVSINGGGEVAFSKAEGATADSTGGGYGVMGGTFYSLANSGDTSLVGHSTSDSGGFGRAGIMTPVLNLPSDDFSYSGSWSGHMNPASISNLTSGVGGGSMSLNYTVETGAIDGTFTGSLNTGTVYPISGIVIAQADGSAISGTFIANTGTYQGSAALGGAFYGFAADEMAGAMAGSLNGGDGNHAFYGTFDVDQDP